MRTAERAWGAGALGLVAYEALCPDNEMLTDGARRSIEKHPVLTRALIGGVALHLMGWLPEKIDPLHHISRIIR